MSDKYVQCHPVVRCQLPQKRFLVHIFTIFQIEYELDNESSCFGFVSVVRKYVPGSFTFDKITKDSNISLF
jgi:hypothetical protein